MIVSSAPFLRLDSLLAATSARTAGTAKTSSGAAVRRGVIKGLLVGGQERVERSLRLAVDRGELPVEAAGRGGQLIDRRSVVLLDRGAERVTVGPKVGLDGLRVRVCGGENADRAGLLSVG